MCVRERERSLALSLYRHGTGAEDTEEYAASGATEEPSLLSQVQEG